MDAIAHYRQSFEQLRGQQPSTDPAWLWKLRDQALRAFSGKGFPSTHDEEWRYTSVAPIAQTPFRAADSTSLHAELSERLLHEHALDEGERLVFVDGHLVPALSRVERVATQGVRVGSLLQALRDDEALVRQHLGRYAEPAAHPLAALNAAMMVDGALVYVPADTRVSEPVTLCFIQTGAQPQTAAHVHNLIVAERGCRLALSEVYLGPREAQYWSNVVTEVTVGANATVERYKVQREGRDAYHTAGLHVHQAGASSFRSHVFSFGGALVRDDIDVRLAGEETSCVLNGLLLASGAQHVDAHTTVDHVTPRGTSAELYKGIFADQATGVFNGKVYVRPRAQQTDAKQSNRNLLLSNEASVNAKPQLEIFADDVRCTHGATVGQLDHEAVFYLRARGLDEALARRLLTQAFAKEVIDLVESDTLRAQLDQWLVDELDAVLGSTGSGE